MRCCNKDQNTRFCPDCGKKLYGTSVLVDLLFHCKNQEGKYTRMSQERADARLAAKDTKLAEKWGMWAKALNELLQNRP